MYPFLIVIYLFLSSHPPEKITLYTIGDSTMANKDTLDGNEEHGWGQVLQTYFDPAKVRVSNHAKNGRSSKSFVNEGRWQAVYDSLKPGDYVFIQFGHNDEKKDRDELFTDPRTTYPQYLTKFVTETREKGAHPVLMTSIVRRKFDGEGQLVDTHGAYPDAVRELAGKLEVPLVDMELKTRKLVQDKGPEASKPIYLWLEKGESRRHPEGLQDNTHLSKYGALSIAGLAVEGIRELGLPMAGYLADPPPRVLFYRDGKSSIYLDSGESEVVHIALSLLREDVRKVFKAQLLPATREGADADMIVGTLGQSPVLDAMAEKGQIDLSVLEGRWETYLLRDIPWQGRRVLVIAGSDSRATAYGLLELSRRIGVSPWVWWADVPPAEREVYSITEGLTVLEAPKVKFRGIFLNDEDWGLQPWAAKTFEAETGDIGPKTYGKIFELLLRLRANTIWPAMHPSTRAFYTIPGNREMAARYQIFVGTSHAEPMLRNNVGEWDHDRYGEYNYSSNRDTVKRYWQRRIEELEEDDRYIITLGMRGIHDSGMQGDLNREEKVDLLEAIFHDQRELLENVLDKDIQDIPQAFVPYKEVLEIYNDGAAVPEDVTLVWPDDNHGYIRRLSDAAERKRPGGAGVYYHLSYWGRPHDFLWLESVPVSLIWEEMNKAFHTGAQTIWIANVGDIKPNEIGMNFFLEMAWDPEQFEPDKLNAYYTRFAERQFGNRHAQAIGQILGRYFQLGFARKPEHMGWTSVYPNTPIQDPAFSLFHNGDEVQQRLDAYLELEDQVERLLDSLPQNQVDAFYQLVAYKVLGAANMNKKLLYAHKSREYAKQGRVSASQYAARSAEAFEKIQAVTRKYNQLSGGKWNHMMVYDPRELPVFGMPEVGRYEPTEPSKGGLAIEGRAEPLEPDSRSGALPVFISSSSRNYFIDIFNAGTEPLRWSAETRVPWIQLSSSHGQTFSQERVWVSVDWSRFPDINADTASLSFRVGGSTYAVHIEAQKTDKEGNNVLLVEDNSVVAIEAEHFTQASNTNGRNWKIIQGLGRQNDAVGSFPVTAPAALSGEAPELMYNVFTTSRGEVEVRVYCLPTHPISEHYRMRFAVSMDDGAPVILDASLEEAMDEHNAEWQRNVLRAATIPRASLEIGKPGRHTLKIRMVDPGVVIDRIELVFGERQASYFGFTETRLNFTPVE